MDINEDRRAVVHRFQLGETTAYLIVALKPCVLGERLQPEEVQLFVEQVGSTAHGMCSTFALMLTLALKHNLPLKDICNLLENMSFSPAGFTRNTTIPVAKSIPDYISRWLRQRFLIDPNEQGERK